jgi:hypothetical protein
MLTSARIWVQAFTGKGKRRFGSVSEEIGRTKVVERYSKKGEFPSTIFILLTLNTLWHQLVNSVMRQCGNVGRRAMRSGAPAVTPGGSAQAGNAQCPMPNASRSVCRIAALANCLIAILPYLRVP